MRIVHPGGECASVQTITAPLAAYLVGSDYDTSLLPVCEPGQKVTLVIDMALRQFLDMVSMRSVPIRTPSLRLVVPPL
jgi:hypothetical protein